MRLIDADKLLDILGKSVREMRGEYVVYKDAVIFAYMDAILSVRCMPTIYPDGDHIRHGHWIPQYPEDKNCGLVKCSCCNYEYNDLVECLIYCGNCGAKMDEPMEVNEK